MKKALLSIAFVLMLVFSAAAQEKPVFDPDYAWNTIRAEYGALIPAGSVPNRSFGVLLLSYTRRFSGRWGWRTGAQYASLGAPADQYVGLPFSVVYRLFTAPYGGRGRKAWVDSMDDASWHGGGDVPAYERQRMRNDVTANVLNIFLRRTEFFSGVTPGYLPGLEPDHRFSLAADAGMTLSIPLGRFSLDITPAAHYLITDNFGGPRWLYSISGGLSFLF
jgi:hypothetical protein